MPVIIVNRVAETNISFKLQYTIIISYNNVTTK